MSDETMRHQLEIAFGLIRHTRLVEAVIIINPILAQDADNVDAWWLLANAVSEPEEARRALLNVLRLNPHHSQAASMLARLNTMFPPATASATVPDTRPVKTASQPPALTEVVTVELTELADLGWMEDGDGQEDRDTRFVSPDDQDVAVDDGYAYATERGSGVSMRSLFLLVAFIAAVVAASGAVLALRYFSQSKEPASDPLDQALVMTTERLSGGQLGVSEAELADTSLGKALVVVLCDQANPGLPTTVLLAMRIAAEQGAGFPGLIQAVGVEVHNCTRQDRLFRAVAPIEQAAAYYAGTLSGEAFQATWLNE